MIDHKAALVEIVPEDDEEKREFLKAMMALTREMLIEHAHGDKDNALYGFTLLAKDVWIKKGTLQ